ncbi:MAG: transcription-repair coupling factor [Clostridiales bacterium GWF2_36_10]|nr:MAG: transcription-repair coupling factor [Clostridiales bacterium GWF2_36_10]HAN20517.1 transcription-repair coupling factor [Clostridiales bacterium]
MEAILSQFNSDSEYVALKEGFKEGHIPCIVNGICDSARPFLIAATLKDTNSKGLVVVSDEKEAYRLKSDLEMFFEKVFVYPSRDFVFDNIKSYSKEWEHERLAVLQSIDDGNYNVIITLPDAMSQYTMPKKILRNSTITLTRGKSADVASVCEHLYDMGYTRTEVVEGAGQFALRGGILDVFSPQYKEPLRVDFFGDEVDLIGFFDIITQRRNENVHNVIIIPSNEILISPESREHIKKELGRLIHVFKGTEKQRDSLKRELEAAESGEYLAFADKFLSLIYSEKECLLDYMSDYTTFVIESGRVRERKKGFDFTLGQNIENLVAAGNCSYKTCDVAFISEYIFEKLGHRVVALDLFMSSGKLFPYKAQYNIASKSIVSFNKNLELLYDDLENYIAAHQKILILTGSERSSHNLIENLEEKDIASFLFSGALYDGTVAVGVLPTATPFTGFELVKAGFVLLTDAESVRVSGGITKMGTGKGLKLKKGEKIASYADLAVGDLVVHINHGIGRFEGIQNLVSEGVSKDYIKIVYADNGVLYVPCNQLDLVSKFIGGKDTVKLSKMGSAEWKRAKAKAKSAANDIAKELIRLYAERQKKEGYAFPADDEMQDEFEALFEYTETDGQITASQEIKLDMQHFVPMDRLLCGDVGFGKTEVALRAAFKCVFGGKQAAVLVPTTILAWQHYQTFQARFRGYPVKIAMLSRFVSKSEQAQIIKDLTRGNVDIVIGTHRVLQRDIEFADLGLLIVDEEQRFGVTHKERLKQLASNVHVLTLTATPIPRTLNMALSGIRDMSVLEEAPSDRVPVQTYVLEHDDEIVHEAIRKELRRGGQVFYLHNFVDSIYAKAAKLGEVFTEANIAIAHGKIEKEQLSDVWAAMIEGKVDILVCTTIIETGVNVPNANTLIIEEANRMGLSQLHQIRGRIGRSTRKAYAYLTYRSGSLISELASKRLEAIREFTEFGSGFKIAMRDLELRGAGNILGAEQSGHMEAVGYDLYIKILEEAVNEQKGVPPKQKLDCTVDIAVDAYITEKYISSAKLRIDVYRKIANIENDEDRDDLLDELTDRFGDLPKPTQNLIDISLIRNAASILGFSSVEQKGNIVSLYNRTLDIKISSAIASEPEFKGTIMISAGAKPHLAIRLRSGDNNLEIIKRVLNFYTKLSQK